MSEAAQEEIERASRTNENQVLAAYAASPDASLSEIARSLGWLMKTGEPDKTKVKRATAKLKGAKLVTIERGKPVITERGEQAFERCYGKSWKWPISDCP